MKQLSPDYHKTVGPKWNEHSSSSHTENGEDQVAAERQTGEQSEHTALDSGALLLDKEVCKSSNSPSFHSNFAQNCKICDSSIFFFFIQEIHTGHCLSI